MTEFAQSYYDEINGRLRAILVQVADSLPDRTREFVADELDANELGLSLETIVEALNESGTWVDSRIVAELSDLAAKMNMNVDVSAALTSSAVPNTPNSDVEQGPR